MTLAFTLLFSFLHITAGVDSTDRSPRPTSAPAIAQSQVTEGIVPGGPAQKTVVSKTQKETVEDKKEEAPPEQAEPEPTEVWKVCLKFKNLPNSLSDLEVLTP